MSDWRVVRRFGHGESGVRARSGRAAEAAAVATVIAMGARVVLFGATGYTGARTAQAMVGRGLRPVLAGRDPERLAALARRLGGLETAVAQVTDKASVAALVARGDVL